MNDPYGLAASGIPPEMIAKMQGVNRQQAIAQALLNQSMVPSDNPTNPGAYASRMSPLNPIAKVLQAYMAREGLARADQEQANLRTQAENDRSEALARYERMKSGEQLTQGDDDGNPMPQVPGDPRKAIAMAMSNSYLQNSPLVRADLDALKKSQEPYSLRQGEKRMSGNQVLAENAAKPQQFVINGKVYTTGPDGKVVEMGGPGPAADPNKPFNPDGSPNTAYQEYDIKRAGAGATRVQTNVTSGKKFFETVQEKAGDQVASVAQQARGAVDTINTVNQIRDALDSGKVSAGPGATATQYLGQLGQVMGVGGKDNEERLSNTRTVINKLAQLELDAAQQMRGQGAITEAERSIIRRAAAGDISEMTVPELRTLTDVMERSARLKITNNAANVTRLRSQPGAAEIVDYIDVQMPPQYTPKRRAADKATVLRFDANGNPLK